MRRSCVTRTRTKGMAVPGIWARVKKRAGTMNTKRGKMLRMTMRLGIRGLLLSCRDKRFLCEKTHDRRLKDKRIHEHRLGNLRRHRWIWGLGGLYLSRKRRKRRRVSHLGDRSLNGATIDMTLTMRAPNLTAQSAALTSLKTITRVKRPISKRMSACTSLEPRIKR
jgi:hypothetical protein